MNKRQKEVIQHNLDSEKAVLKQLEKQYQAALNDINIKIKILQSDELTQSRIYRIEHQQALKGQVEAILDKLHSDEYDSINKYLNDSYTDAFIGTMYDLHGQGVPLITPIDQKAAVKAVMTDSQINEGLYKHLGVDTKNLKKAIQNEITRGIATGMPYSEIARNISNTTKAPLARANTIVRTEAHRIQQASTHDAQVKAKDKGADIVKQWDASLDGATRPTHRQLDGQIREIDEPFKAHGKSAMYPGDFGDPAEDCNCRCVTLQRAKWALGEEELQTLKDRAEFFELDKSKDFEDFKAKYMKAAELMKQSDEKQAEIKARREAYFARKNKEAKFEQPDFAGMSASEIGKWTEKNLKTKFVDVSGANKDFVAETAKAVAQFEHKMGGKTINGLSVKFGGTPKGVHAKYDDATKTLILKKSGSLQNFVESQEKANARYHAKWHTGKDYYATTTFSGTVFHELGHAVDIDVGQSLSKHLSVNPYLFEESVKVSAYAGSMQGVRVTPRSEAWAENFAAYMDGGANRKKVPDEIVNMIEDYFNGKK